MKKVNQKGLAMRDYLIRGKSIKKKKWKEANFFFFGFFCGKFECFVWMNAVHSLQEEE